MINVKETYEAAADQVAKELHTLKVNLMQNWEEREDDVNLMYETDPEWKAAIDHMGKLIAEEIDREIINELIKKAKKRKETDENIQE